MLRVTFLGTGGSLPTPERNPSAILVNRKGELMLFDCGEGTQQQMMRAKTGMGNLTSIFITHFHADHILGIPGLIQTMNFNGRTEPLKIYGPHWVEEFVRMMTAIGFFKLKFEVKAFELHPGDRVDRGDYYIEAIKTEHSVPSIGYALVEADRPGRFDRERAVEFGVPPGPLFKHLQTGEDVEVDGNIIKSSDVTGPPRPGRKIVYSGDTRPCSGIFMASDKADLLIHDSTLTDDMVDWANESMHSTAGEAASLAALANVHQLVLTHISPRYSDDTSQLLEDAKEEFENAIIAVEFMEIEIPYRDV
ncbi:MAG: ribonuclease Z [ANME-2 cluster archaeon]|nr:ribonuclease Z [ANME-2 cluster archaeon]MDF1557738.1 ribonuclease Z [ANME-2 cluster archaeon]